MARASCVPMPRGTRFVCIREDFIGILNGDHCAAALLHELIWVLDCVIGQTGKAASFKISLRDLEGRMLEHYGRTTIRPALEKLHSMGFVKLLSASPCCELEVDPDAVNEAVRKRTVLSENGQPCPKTDSLDPDDTLHTARAHSSEFLQSKQTGAPEKKEVVEPDPGLRIDRWVEETATAVGKTCARFAKKEREHLIASDTPELRESLGASIRCTLSSEVSDVVLQVADYHRNSPRAPMQRASSRPPPPRYERPRKETLAERMARIP